VHSMWYRYLSKMKKGSKETEIKKNLKLIRFCFKYWRNNLHTMWTWLLHSQHNVRILSRWHIFFSTVSLSLPPPLLSPLLFLANCFFIDVLSRENAVCFSCDPGTYCNSSGCSRCELCSAGYYSLISGKK
jgi:hypothetical protein